MWLVVAWMTLQQGIRIDTELEKDHVEIKKTPKCASPFFGLVNPGQKQGKKIRERKKHISLGTELGKK